MRHHRQTNITQNIQLILKLKERIIDKLKIETSHKKNVFSSCLPTIKCVLYLLLCELLFLWNHQSNVSFLILWSFGLPHTHAESDSRSDPVEFVRLSWHGEYCSLLLQLLFEIAGGSGTSDGVSSSGGPGPFFVFGLCQALQFSIIEIFKNAISRSNRTSSLIIVLVQLEI